MTAQKIDYLAKVALLELARARNIHGKLASAHEGYAVILEELDELKAEVWKQFHDRDAMKREAIHVAAMAMRFVLDICDTEDNEDERI